MPPVPENVLIPARVVDERLLEEQPAIASEALALAELSLKVFPKDSGDLTRTSQVLCVHMDTHECGFRVCVHVCLCTCTCACRCICMLFVVRF